MSGPRKDETGGPTGDSRPLAIIDSSGSVASARMTEKAFQKSVESGELWVAEGRRVLPWKGCAPQRLRLVREAVGCYVALLDDDGATEPGTANDRPVGGPDMLATLEAVIASRRREMPEGSYTTYLFSSGSKKIRKKVGEEAIEVIGADSAAELVSESADLLYHLLVLLAAEDVQLDQVLADLGARHG